MPTTEPTTETRYLVRQDSPAARDELDELSRLQAKAAGVSTRNLWCAGKRVAAADAERLYPGGLRHSRPEPDASGTRLRIDVLAPEAEQPWTEEAKSLTPQERGKLQAARAAQVKKPADWHVPRASQAIAEVADLFPLSPELTTPKMLLGMQWVLNRAKLEADEEQKGRAFSAAGTVAALEQTRDELNIGMSQGPERDALTEKINTLIAKYWVAPTKPEPEKLPEVIRT